MMLVSLAGFSQITVSKLPFVLKGKTFITPTLAVVKGVNEITLNFNETKLPVSDLQSVEIGKKVNSTDFLPFQKNVLAIIQILQDSVKSMTAQIAALKVVKPVVVSNIPLSPYADSLLKKWKSDLNTQILSSGYILSGLISSKADSSAIAKLPELSFPGFNVTGDSLHYTISSAPKRVTLAQRLAMKNVEPGLEVYQMDGNKPGIYYFSKAINDWGFLYN